MANDRGFIGNTLDAMRDNLFVTIIACLVLGAAGDWTYKMYSTYRDTEIQKARIQAGLELKVGDYNGNALLDKYYEIDGKKIPVEVDGRPIANYFNLK